MMKRRIFIQKTTTAATGLVLAGCIARENKPKVRKGEEWRIVDKSLVSSDYHEKREEIIGNALEGIEKYRKSNVTLSLLTKEGQPIKNKKVKIQQTKSHFDWGSSFGGTVVDFPNKRFTDETTENFVKLFNCVTAKCYWDEHWHQPVETEEGKRITDVFRGEVDWALKYGLRAKGHPLVWTVRKAIPKWMDKYPYKKQLKIMEAHVRDMIRVGGKDVTRWDLCNEMLWEPSLRHLPQRNWPHIETIDEILTYLEPAVHWARQENPDPVYSINDYGLVKTYNGKITAEEQRRRYVELIAEMQKRGCAPDAMGTQCHVAGWYTPLEFVTMLDDLAQAGIPLQVTEFWARANNNPQKDKQNATQQEKALAQYVRDIYTIGFGHPRMTHFTYWGSEYFNRNGTPNIMYDTLYKMIREEWMTTIETETDDKGEIAFRGFQGKYELLYGDSKMGFEVLSGEKNRFQLHTTYL
jgi:GH35 family endo-1,4-beta-xylanase